MLASCGEKHLQLDRAKKAVGASAGNQGARVTFERDIRPIFKDKCSMCHNTGSAIPNWDIYDVSFSLKDRLMNRVVVLKNMPIGTTMTEQERGLLAEWIQLGAPQGKVVGADEPTAPETAPPVVEPVQPAPVEPPPPVVVIPDPVPAPQPSEPVSGDTTPTVPSSGDGSVAEPVAPGAEIVTFTKVKTEVFDKYCALCHNENSGETMPNWGDYDISVARKDKLYNRVIEKMDMPMPGLPMTDEARELLKKWIDQGTVK